LEPGIGRGAFYPDVEIYRLKTMGVEEAHGFMAVRSSFLRLNENAYVLLRNIFRDIDHILDELRGNVHHWFELLLWRERGLMWGMDLQSAYSPFRWPWMPLFDRELLKLSWNITVEQKVSGHFLNDVFAELVPPLKDIGCTRYTGMKKQNLAGRIKRRAGVELRHFRNKLGIFPQMDKSSRITRFWEMTLLNKKKHLWGEFIEKKELTRLIRLSPQSDLLWRLLSIDCLAETCIDEYKNTEGEHIYDESARFHSGLYLQPRQDAQRSHAGHS
jgi:hypothetical protein